MTEDEKSGLESQVKKIMKDAKSNYKDQYEQLKIDRDNWWQEKTAFELDGPKNGSDLEPCELGKASS